MVVQAVSGAAQGGVVSEAPTQTAQRQAPAGEVVKPAAETVKVAGDAVRAVAAASNPEVLKQAVDMVNQLVQSHARGLEFSLDEDTQRTVVKLIDRETDEVLRQIPAEEILAIAKALDKLQGLLIRQTA